MKPGKKCKLRLFTWTWVELNGRKEVTPTCPDHGPEEVRSRSFGNGVLFVCQVMDHILNHCTYQELQAEREEAETLLSAKAAGVR